jgi:hypothetical protein
MEMENVLKAGGPVFGPEATVPGCSGPLAQRPKAEAAWPAHAGRRGAPPCRGNYRRGRDGGATGLCSPVALVRRGLRREHRGGEAHPSATRRGGSQMGSVDGEAEGYRGTAGCARRRGPHGGRR